MSADQIVNLVVAVLTGLAACIPLAVKLVQYVQKSTQEKNWGTLLGLEGSTTDAETEGGAGHDGDRAAE